MSDVVITQQRILCPRHGELFRYRWPAGFSTFANHALVWLFEDEGFTRFLHYMSAEVLLDHTPACCRLPRQVLLSLLVCSHVETAFMVNGLCWHCRAVSLGGPFEFTRFGASKRVDHLCVDCVLDGTFCSPKHHGG